MLKTIRVAYFALGLVVLVVEDLMDGVPGLQKKEEALKRVKEVVTAILGFWPAWIPDLVLGWAIDAIVATLQPGRHLSQRHGRSASGSRGLTGPSPRRRPGWRTAPTGGWC